MTQKTQLNNKRTQSTTDNKGTAFASYFYGKSKKPLDSSQALDLLNYVKRMATGHAYKRYYYGDLNNPPQPDYIEDLTQYALLSLYSGYTTRYKKLVGGAKTVTTTLKDCEATIDKITKVEKPLTDLQAFRRFIYISFNDYNYNERSTTATIGARKTIPLELEADGSNEEMLYITDLLDFVKWTEKELNGLHAESLTADDLQLLKDCYNAQSKEKQRYLSYIAYSPLCRKSATAEFNNAQRRKGKKAIDAWTLQRVCIRYLRAGLKSGKHSNLLITLVNSFINY